MAQYFPLSENLVRSEKEVERFSQRKQEMVAPEHFIKAVQQDSILCPTPDCGGHVQCTDVSPMHERVKTFQLHCMRCEWKGSVCGHEDLDVSWDEAELQAIIDEHLLHLQPICPFDQSPVVFTSLPNPRRRARYRIACHYCGRSEEMDWPPQESKW